MVSNEYLCPPVGVPKVKGLDKWADAFAAVADELMVRKSKLEHLNASSKASIQHFPAALFGARKIR